MSDPLEGDSTTQSVPGLKGANAAGGDGVFGTTAGGAGVHGENRSGKGAVVSQGFLGGTDPVLGEDAGAYGESSKQGVLGHSDVGTGLLGHTNSGFAVRGENPNGRGFIGGVDAVFNQPAGVYGESGQRGVVGFAKGKGAVGVHGVCKDKDGNGVVGEAINGIGIVGIGSDSGAAAQFIGDVLINGVLQVNNRQGPAARFLGDVEIDGALRAPAADGLHLFANSIRIHGSDLLLDGRSGQGGLFRALVDAGNKLIINFNGDYQNGVEVASSLVVDGALHAGDLLIDGTMQASSDEGLNLAASSLRIHGSDLILDGRSGQDNLFRALVDAGNKLIINFNGDYENGVEVMSDLVVDGKVRSSGGDCAEQFDIAADAAAEPGTVMVIGADGRLEPCMMAYDSRVAGVVSGAGDLKTAFVLNDQIGHRAAIALMGTVYCKVEASDAPIAAGDLLTTSATPGHAMKAAELDRGFGAVIGKALGSLRLGTGLIPILVAPR